MARALHAGPDELKLRAGAVSAQCGASFSSGGLM
jgi:hypothetical protein